MSTKEKPKHVLLLGSKSEDLASLARLYEAMSGKKPTEQEMEDAQKLLDE